MTPPGDYVAWNIRCVYCREKFRSTHDLLEHEPGCDMRLPIQRFWAARIQEAREAETADTNAERWEYP